MRRVAATIVKLIPIVLLLHSMGWLGPQESGGQEPSASPLSVALRWWIIEDTRAMHALERIDPFWVAKQYINTVRPQVPFFCQGDFSPLCEIDRANVEKQTHDPGFWITHIPGLIVGVPMTTIAVLLSVYKEGHIAGVIALICVLLAGMFPGLMLINVNDDEQRLWLAFLFSPFAGSLIAWVVVSVLALPFLRVMISSLQLAVTITASGIGLYSFLDRGHLMMNIYEGCLLPTLRKLSIVKAPEETAGAKNVV